MEGESASPPGMSAQAGIANAGDEGSAKGAQQKPHGLDQSFIEDFPAPIWRAARDGLCDYFNKAWLEFTGRRMEEELGEGWAEGVHPDDREQCVKDYLDAFHAREPFSLVYRLRGRDGEYHWMHDAGRPFYARNGEFAGYIGGCIDVTERKRMEEALARSEPKRAPEGRGQAYQDLHEDTVQAMYAIGLELIQSARMAAPEPGAADPCPSLSRQERRVLSLVAAGKTNKEIAAAMGLSPKTVKNYLSNVFQKLKVSRRALAAAQFVTTPPRQS